MDALAALSDLMRPLRNRVALMISRAVLAGLNDGSGLQVVQLKVRAGDDLHSAERFQNYGLSSVPLDGADVLVVAIGGVTSHLAVAAIDDRRCRPTNLKPGEVMLYDHLGKFIHLLDDGTILIKGTKVRIESTLEVTEEVKDRCDGAGMTMSGMRATYDAHDHGGIEPGAGTTADPNQEMGGH